MGHYASEMDANWNAGDKEITARANAGFKPVNPYGGGTYECPRCSASIVNWRKHKAVCTPETK